MVYGLRPSMTAINTMLGIGPWCEAKLSKARGNLAGCDTLACFDSEPHAPVDEAGGHFCCCYDSSY